MPETPKKIAVLYSRGPHLIRLLHFLRKTYPTAQLFAYLPEGYPTKYLDGLMDGAVFLPRETHRSLHSQLRLLRLLRSSGAGMMVIMFPSVRLRMFAKLTGIRHLYCFTVNGEFLPVGLTLLSEAFQLLQARITGYCAYLKIKIHLAFNRIGH